MSTKIIKLITLWLWGGFIYYCIGMVYRGYSHPSMFIVGGLCFLLLGVINNFLPWELGFIPQCIAGGFAITAVEFVSGVILNMWLKLGIWDYSGMRFNILGQVCLPYVFVWVALSAVGIWLDDYLRWKLYGEVKPHYSIV